MELRNILLGACLTFGAALVAFGVRTQISDPLRKAGVYATLQRIDSEQEQSKVRGDFISAESRVEKGRLKRLRKAEAMEEDARRSRNLTADERSAEGFLTQAEMDLGTIRGYSGDDAATLRTVQEAEVRSSSAEVRYWQLIGKFLRASNEKKGSETARKDLQREVINAESLLLSNMTTLRAATVLLADTERSQDKIYEHDVMAMRGAFAQVHSTLIWGEIALVAGIFLLYLPVRVYFAPRRESVAARRMIAGSQSQPNSGVENQRSDIDRPPEER